MKKLSEHARKLVGALSDAELERLKWAFPEKRDEALHREIRDEIGRRDEKRAQGPD